MYKKIILCVASVAILTACGDDSTQGGDPCNGVECSSHGRCVVSGAGEGAQAVCLCDTGFRADGLECVEIVSGAECDGVDCSGHGRCVVAEGDPNFPACLCDEGFVLVGTTTCVEVESGGGLRCGAGTHQEGEECVSNEDVRPQGFCEPDVMADNGRIPVTHAGAPPFALEWAGDHYLVIYRGGSGALVAQTVTPAGQVGQQVTVVSAQDMQDIQGASEAGLVRCGDKYCGYVGARPQDQPTKGFVLDGSGNLQASVDLPSGWVIGMAGGQNGAYAVTRSGGFVSVAPDGTTGPVVPFGDESRIALAVARSSDLAPMLVLDAANDEGLRNPRVAGWDETGSMVFGPVDVLSGLDYALTASPLLERTPSGFLVVAITTRATYSEGFDSQGSSRGAWFLNEVGGVGELAVCDAFAFVGQAGPQTPMFEVLDVAGRPVTDMAGALLLLDVGGFESSSFPPRLMMHGAAPESDRVVGSLVSWNSGTESHIDLVRIGCQ